MKEFFKNLLDVLFPDPKKKNCPYCGGGKCFGLCGMQGDEDQQPANNADVAVKQDAAARKDGQISRPDVNES
jgi:hypothetical protein